MKFREFLPCITILLIIFAIHVNAEIFPVPQIPFSPKRYICYQSGTPLNIDGKLDENAWKKAEWTDYFEDIEGDLKPAPRFKTRAKMLWDDNYFYVAAVLDEPQVWANLKQRDTVIFYDNDFEIFIDPDGDTHEYYEYEMNALSTYWELLLTKPYREGGSAVNAFDIKGLKTAATVQGTLNNPKDIDKSWTVEVAIPWDVLKECAHKPAPPVPGEQWRVNFSRVEWKTDIVDGKYRKTINPITGRPFPEDNWVWSPQGVINMHYPEMWGYVQFSEKTAGNGVDQFVVRPEEEAKWALRRIYYAEKNYRMKNGKYTPDIYKLGLSEVATDNYVWPPRIEVTTSNFEATIKRKDRDETWHILGDGRTFREEQ